LGFGGTHHFHLRSIVYPHLENYPRCISSRLLGAEYLARIKEVELSHLASGEIKVFRDFDPSEDQKTRPPIRWTGGCGWTIERLWDVYVHNDQDCPTHTCRLQPSFSPGEVIVSMYMYLVISSFFLSLLLHVGERARV